MNTSTQNSVALSVNDGVNTNIALVLKPKGSSGIMVNTPNGAVSGGNARGAKSIDLQFSRATNSQVASGDYSVILGGENNVASGLRSIASGYANVSGGVNSIAFGDQNISSGPSSIALGTQNIATGSGMAITIGKWLATEAYTGNTNITLGMGLSSSSYLLNPTPNSLAVGFNSTTPQFIVDCNTSNVKVGIGIPNPQASLHTVSASTSVPALQIGTSSTASGFPVYASMQTLNNAGLNPSTTDGYSVYYFTGSAPTGNVTLSGAGIAGKVVHVINSSSASISVNISGGTISIAQNRASAFISNGTSWFPIQN
jgi:hypothetical protein